MTDHAADPTLDRLLRHMAWANAAVFATLAGLTDDALAVAAPRNEWTVAMILEHLVSSAGGYTSRLEGVPRPDRHDPPTAVAELAGLATTCAAFDARLRAQAAAPDGPVEYKSDAGTIRRARSTILGQAIHHATEHRAQIGDALSTNGIDALDLDELDLWAYSTHEGLGA
jgi:uncharacterized damage-inducible protein DinB